MIDTSSAPPNGGTPEEVEELAPASKRGDEGKSGHGGDVTGPSSDEPGRPLAPQTGEPIDHSH